MSLHLPLILSHCLQFLAYSQLAQRRGIGQVRVTIPPSLACVKDKSGWCCGRKSLWQESEDAWSMKMAIQGSSSDRASVKNACVAKLLVENRSL